LLLYFVVVIIVFIAVYSIVVNLVKVVTIGAVVKGA
jgi:hypothetical protein